MELEILIAIGAALSAVLGIGLYQKSKKKDAPTFPKKQEFEQLKEKIEVEPEAPKLKTLEEALKETKSGFFGKIKGIFSSEGGTLSAEELEELEEVLYTSDLGPHTVQRFMDSILEKKESKELTLENVQEFMKEEMNSIFSSVNPHLNLISETKKPETTQIWMIVGVNGAGKTTTIGKLAHKLSDSGLKVMIAAGDTFRAAAKDQLKVWANRSNVEYFSPEGVDSPSAVAFDACKKALEEKYDILIVDTAGRLHTQEHLMEELKKMKRVITKNEESAPHEVLIVLDANSGQNALIQARQFHETLGLTGVVLTKLDGTAKGGVAVGVVNEIQVPVKLIGIGEGIEDLRTFNNQEFISSIL